MQAGKILLDMHDLDIGLAGFRRHAGDEWWSLMCSCGCVDACATAQLSSLASTIVTHVSLANYA
jgi:hypothetical protein